MSIVWICAFLWANRAVDEMNLITATASIMVTIVLATWDTIIWRRPWTK